MRVVAENYEQTDRQTDRERHTWDTCSNCYVSADAEFDIYPAIKKTETRIKAIKKRTGSREGNSKHLSEE